jgi:hypothetical protein
VHNYLVYYDRLLSPFRERQFLMIEIGVFRGSSLKMWGEFFPNAKIVGVDIEPSARQFEVDNKFVRIGDASKLEFVHCLIGEFGRPLIVLDDGSHIWDQQIRSLQYFFPLLLPGGVFIEEDLHTSFPAYGKRYQGKSSIDCYNYILQMNRALTGAKYMEGEKPFDSFIAEYTAAVASIEWFRSTCAIKKM